MKILFVSYHFEPYPHVGAKRVSYWAKNFKKQIDKEAQIDVLTSTAFEQKSFGIDNQIRITKNKKSILSFLIKDEGLDWSKSIKTFFIENPEIKYDIVLMSGGPFMQFNLIKWMKNRWTCRVILDYRDPFSNNPRFKNSFIKKRIKRYFEKKYNKAADSIITVNTFCLSLLSVYKSNPEKFFVIPNGYDETGLNEISPADISDKMADLNLIYAGSITEDRHPGELIKALKKFNKEIKFHHVGRETDLVDYSNQSVENYGVRSYEETLAFIKSCQIGLVITSGVEFESTTKIYDYMGVGVKILILTNGKVKTGSLHEETKEYNVVWAENNEDAIVEILSVLKNQQNLKLTPYTECSRKEGLKKLAKLIY